jgi:hypothetical protein
LTSPNDTNWIVYSLNPAGLYVNVDTSSCAFTSVPNYSVMMGGTTSHWTSYGTSNLYYTTKTSFRVYIASVIHTVNGEVVSHPRNVTQAKGWEWHIQWCGVQR